MGAGGRKSGPPSGAVGATETTGSVSFVVALGQSGFFK